MYFDNGDEVWDEEMEARVLAMEAVPAPPPAPPVPSLQLKPVAPSFPSILKPTSFRLPFSKPTAPVFSNTKPSVFKSKSKAKPKPKPRAAPAAAGHLATNVSLGGNDHEGEEEQEEESNHQDVHRVVKSRTKLAPEFPPVNSTSIGAPFIDVDKADTWIYPSNYPKRDYQFSIVTQALFKNTLVSLPTGLGKTFIAAVVMYNYFRWFPTGKIVFMAPTKPLVAQQIAACRDIVGIPVAQTAEMTGQMAAEQRRVCWKERRVFFVTPQVLANDLESGYCPREKFVCVVVDEAHRAQVRDIASATSQFRVLALTATPGSTIAQVQHVISNLLISHLEVRSEHDLDVRQYTHEKLVEQVIVPLSDEVQEANRLFIELLKIPIHRLCNQGAFFQRDVEKVSQFMLVQEQRKLQANPPPNLQDQIGLIISQFGMAISLYSAWKLLLTHGIACARKSLEDTEQKALQGQAKNKKELLTRVEWISLLRYLREKQEALSHPKLEKLEEIVKAHFERYSDSRAMIFSSFRDSVAEISAMLERHQPLVKPMTFIGQSSQRSKGLSQKEQTRIVKEFRDGRHNCLVSTSIGEEGLDIGEVDLIVCYDSQQSPIRLVQRMGRTGRKRQGRCVVLLSGAEEMSYKNSRTKKKSIDKTMLEKRLFAFKLYEGNNRMIPPEIKPKVQLVELAIPSAKQVLEEAPQLLPDPDEPAPPSLDDEQRVYMADKWTVSASQQPESLIRALNRDASRHVVPSPVYKISHSRQCLLLMTSVAWAEEHANDDEDAYTNDLLPFLDDAMIAEPKQRKRKSKGEGVDETAGEATKPAAAAASKKKKSDEKKEKKEKKEKEKKEKTDKKKASKKKLDSEIISTTTITKDNDAKKPAAVTTTTPIASRLDKFRFIRPQARSPSPPAAPSSPSLASQPQDVINLDDNDNQEMVVEKNNAQANKENISGQKHEFFAAADDDDDFDAAFPPLRARLSIPRGVPPSLPKAPVFPVKLLTSPPAPAPPPTSTASRVVAPPAKNPPPPARPPSPSLLSTPPPPPHRHHHSSPSLLSQVPEAPQQQQQQPERLGTTCSPSLLSQETPPKPAAALKSFPPKPPVPLPDFHLDPFADDVPAPPSKPAPPTSSPQALAARSPLVKLQPPKTTAYTPSLLPKPSVPLPSFDLDPFADEPPPPPRASQPPKAPPPIAVAKSFTSLRPPPPAAAAPKTLPPPPPRVELPTFDLDPFADDLPTHKPSQPPPPPSVAPKQSVPPPPPHPKPSVAPLPPPPPPASLPSFDLDPFADPVPAVAKLPVAPLPQPPAPQPYRRLGLASLRDSPAQPPPPFVSKQPPLTTPPRPAAAAPLVPPTPPPSISPPPSVAPQRHEAATLQLDGQVSCPICGVAFPTASAVSRHVDDEHSVPGDEKPSRDKNDPSSESVRPLSSSVKNTPIVGVDDDDDFEDRKRKHAIASSSARSNNKPGGGGAKFRRLRKGAAGGGAEIVAGKKKKAKLRVNRGNEFIDDEAEESDDAEDEEDDDEGEVEELSQYEDDAALASPDLDAVSPKTMMGIYRQSLISTPVKRRLDFSPEDSPVKDSISSSSSSSVFPSPQKPAAPMLPAIIQPPPQPATSFVTTTTTTTTTTTVLRPPPSYTTTSFLNSPPPRKLGLPSAMEAAAQTPVAPPPPSKPAPAFPQLPRSVNASFRSKPLGQTK